MAMSNRDRIERMAAEKAAAAREREAKTKARAEAKAKAPKSSGRGTRTKAPTGRVAIVWTVCNHTGSELKTYPYPEKQQAENEAARLAAEKGTHHYVKRHTVPLDPAGRS